MSIGSQVIPRTAIFRTHHKNFAIIEKWNSVRSEYEKTVHFNIVTLVLDWVGYIGLGFAHLLPDESGACICPTPNKT